MSTAKPVTDERSTRVDRETSEGVPVVTVAIRSKRTGHAEAWLTPKQARKFAAEIIAQADAVDAINVEATR